MTQSVKPSALIERRLNPDGAFRLSSEREDSHRRLLSRIIRTEVEGRQTADELRRDLMLVRGIAMDLFMELEALRGEAR